MLMVVKKGHATYQPKRSGEEETRASGKRVGKHLCGCCQSNRVPIRVREILTVCSPISPVRIHERSGSEDQNHRTPPAVASLTASASRPNASFTPSFGSGQLTSSFRSFRRCHATGAAAMDPRRVPQADLERFRAEEVLYLHSLWRRAPPPNRNRNVGPSPGPALHPAPAAFKKKSKQEKRGKKEKAAAARTDSWPEWPSIPAPDTNAVPTTWGDLAPPQAAATSIPVSAEDRARVAAAQAQHNGLKASQDFFSEEDDSDEDEEDDMEENDGAKMGPFRFFTELFVKDGELREYYEKNYEKGEFSCFACAGIGSKRVRRFRNCMGLVQHAKSTSNAKRRGAHRALAKAVCQVLGWDIKRLPSFVLDTAVSLGRSLSDAGKTQMQDDVQKDVIENEEELPGDTIQNIDAINGNLTENIFERASLPLQE
ncbi:unnamed protein product [Musa hybrid cultivar]